MKKTRFINIDTDNIIMDCEPIFVVSTEEVKEYEKTRPKKKAFVCNIMTHNFRAWVVNKRNDWSIPIK